VTHAEVDAVILTGGTETAFAMLKAKPDLHLLAETGGKNATIVTALADRDQAIKHVLHSAFSHGGQKCSATSLLLLEAEVFDDPDFKRTLCDAVESLTVGSAWDLKSKMGPLIRPPSGDLENGLKVLEPGESWAVLPRRVGDNPNLWSPGVKWGVQPGSYTHRTEFFGPVLGVMRFEKLSEAIALVNQTGYGLTSGLESLDDREQEIWKAGLRAGNLYINRPTTGAIVLRQPFGGMGKSAFGPGIKAGGPNYVAQFMDFADVTPAVPTTPASVGAEPGLADAQLSVLRHHLRELARESNATERNEALRVIGALKSYDRAMKEEFGREHDPMRLVGQDNFRRYLPVHWLRIRVHPSDSFFDLIGRVSAAKTAGCRITVSVPEGLEHPAVAVLEERLTANWAAAIEFVWESDEDLAEVIRTRQTDRIRYAGPERVPAIVWQAAAQTGLCLVSAPVLAEGRIELLWYVQEQSVSFDYHRYGNLGVRAGEARAEVS
jgi:RHH-type proline utilization regulon transcriptional repressor/proline dehydrogenase/delta 1-pyrroline-5-carboxylate dehydrogenase